MSAVLGEERDRFLRLHMVAAPLAARLLRYRHLGTDRLPMHGRSVVVLHRVLEIYLPVAGEIVFPTPHADHVGHVVGPKPLRKITQILAQAWDARIETDENEPLPSREPQPLAAIRRR